MSIRYDKTVRIASLHGAIGVDFSLKSDIDKATSNRGLWGHSEGFMCQMIHCVLCGMPSEASSLLIKSKNWVERAVEIGEKTRRLEDWSNKFQRHLYAIILWLHDGIHDQHSLDLWMTEALKWFQIHPDRVAGSDLALEAVSFINAGAHKDYIALAAPGGIDAIKCSGADEKQMALTLAAQASARKFPEDKVQATVKKFLDNHVGKWLNDGHAVRAAEWMKVVYWKRGEAGISPFDAVRKCLDHVEH